MEEIRIFLAEGFEEIEALTVVDMLRREEMDIKMVSITGKEIVTGSHNISVKADILFEKADFTKTDMLILPGGMPGTENLRAFSPLKDLICLFQREGKKLAAICAAPTVFGDFRREEGLLLSWNGVSVKRCKGNRRKSGDRWKRHNKQRNGNCHSLWGCYYRNL